MENKGWEVGGCIAGSTGYVVVKDDGESVYIPLDEVELLVEQLQRMRQQVYDAL